jgi:hypothetical protein
VLIDLVADKLAMKRSFMQWSVVSGLWSVKQPNRLVVCFDGPPNTGH